MHGTSVHKFYLLTIIYDERKTVSSQKIINVFWIHIKKQNNLQGKRELFLKIKDWQINTANSKDHDFYNLL